MQQTYSVVALPFSHRPDASHHLSLFVSPDLLAEPGERLGDSSVFAQWAYGLREASIEVWCDGGPLAVEPLTAPVRADLWPLVFPADTPVRSYEPPHWSARHWRTFDAARVQEAALTTQAMVAQQSPLTVPGSRQGTMLTRYWGIGVSDNPQDSEARNLAELDEATGELTALTDPVQLARLEGRDAGGFQGMRRELHRARRFYDRPEDATPYARRPTPGAAEPEPARPEPDFHERLALINDHPHLQRLLGVVVDCRVLDLDLLRQASVLSARIVPASGDGECRSPRTTVELAGDALVTAPRRTGDWRGGAAQLGGEDSSFEVLVVDPDGAALKTEQFFGGLGRLLRDLDEGGTSTTAPPALRSSGLTVVRRANGLHTQEAMRDQSEALATLRAGGDDVTLNLEDVTVGVRVEVWDDQRSRWFSLHSCEVDARVDGTGEMLTFTEEGFVEETTPTHSTTVENAPIHVHESLFGWDGWSLSAPRPGNRIRHVDGTEVVEETPVPTDPVTPLTLLTRVSPGTLPRLRYGRSYAFRAWAVDLAGNSRPHLLNPASVPPELAEAATQLSRHQLPSSVEWEPPEQSPGPVRGRRRDPLSGHETIAQALRRFGGPRRADRRAAVGDPIDATALTSLPVEAAALARSSRRVLPHSVSSHAAALSDQDVVALSGSVSDEVTYRRWDPVLPPTVVPRWEFSEGESNHRLVLRSWARQDEPGGPVHLDDPTVYAGTRPGRHATAERHLVPPKTSQFDAELHGAFDAAVGVSDASAQKAWLAAAVHEAGTLFDLQVADWHDLSAVQPQHGIALVHGPDTPQAELRTLPIPAGEAPAAGQYVVHDTDQLRLPFLCDVLATGFNLLFDAGHDRDLPSPLGLEAFSGSYGGTWPAVEPVRLRMVGGSGLDGSLAAGVLTVAVPAGTSLTVRLSSRIDAAGLDLLGPWHNLGSATSRADLTAAALAGALWVVTPSEHLTFVHATNRPLQAPTPHLFDVEHRALGSSKAPIEAVIGVHGPSTEAITVEGSWTDWLDDVSQPEPLTLERAAVAGTTTVEPWEEYVLTGEFEPDEPFLQPGLGKVRGHALVHEFGDTLHREVTYTVRATTRFREYFGPDELTSAPDAQPLDDGRSTLSAPITVHVPNTEVPAPPVVHSVLPLQHWVEEDEPGQPFARRRSRFAGVRVYLERPWYHTGAGELLGLVTTGAPGDRTEFARDPIWHNPGDPQIASPVRLEHLRVVDELPDQSDRGGSATAPSWIEIDGQEREIIGYRPRYNPTRKLWFVDIAFDSDTWLWPFVRLAVVRYQPHSIRGAQVSPVVLADFVQLLPERTTSVSRVDEDTVRVVVSGSFGRHDTAWHHQAQEGTAAWLGEDVGVNRTLMAKVQRRSVPGSDVLWVDLDKVELEPVGHGATPSELAWVGNLSVPADWPVAAPDGPGSGSYRVLVQEWERLPGDRAKLADPDSDVVWQTRLVYADEFELG